MTVLIQLLLFYQTSVKLTVVKNSYQGAHGLVWGSVYVYGLKANKISWVKANGNDVTKNSTTTEKTMVNSIFHRAQNYV